jgi:hypothetical protein
VMTSKGISTRGSRSLSWSTGGFWMFSKPHYFVVFGYDAGLFLAHTGFNPSVRLPAGEFASMWKKMGMVYLVIY